MLLLSSHEVSSLPDVSVSTHKVYAVCVSISGQLLGPVVWSWLTWWQLFFYSIMSHCQNIYICFKAIKKQKNSKEKVSFWAPFHRLPTLHLKSRIMKVQPCTEGAPLPPFYIFSLDACEWRLSKQPSATSGGSHAVCTNTSVFVCVCFYFNRANSHGFPVSLLRRGNNKGCLDIIPSSPLLQLSVSRQANKKTDSATQYVYLYIYISVM